MPASSTARHQRHGRRGLAPRRPPSAPTRLSQVHRPAEEAVLATVWRLEVSMSFERSGSARPSGWPEC
jgi:hypothetical protein